MDDRIVQYGCRRKAQPGRGVACAGEPDPFPGKRLLVADDDAAMGPVM